MMKAVKVNIIFTLVVVVLIYFIYTKSNKDFNLKTLIYQNLILLLFVGLTEFSIITFYAADYVSIDTNNIKLNVVKNVEKLINSIKLEPVKLNLVTGVQEQAQY
jgi:RsiW-degrading membrane proteinase PrsW (M82 family)